MGGRSRLSGVLKRGICSTVLGVAELMVGEGSSTSGSSKPCHSPGSVCPCPSGFCMQCPPLLKRSFRVGVLATSTVFSEPEGWLWPYCTEARPICVKQAGLLVWLSLCGRLQGPSYRVLCLHWTLALPNMPSFAIYLPCWPCHGSFPGASWESCSKICFFSLRDKSQGDELIGQSSPGAPVLVSINHIFKIPKRHFDLFCVSVVNHYS